MHSNSNVINSCLRTTHLTGKLLLDLKLKKIELKNHTTIIIFNFLRFYFAYSLLDASLNVKSGLIDVQGNTFESLTGKPFISLEPATSNVFENKNILLFLVQ